MTITINSKSLETKMFEKDIKRTEVASLLGVSYSTINSRFKGETPWLYEECIKIRDAYFKDIPLNELFPYIVAA